MAPKSKKVLPDHPAELLLSTPSGTARLLAAWDGLHAESQILILTELPSASFPAYLAEKIRRC